MDRDRPGCGPLYALYAAARGDDVDDMRAAWAAVEADLAAADAELAAQLDAAVTDGDTAAARRAAAALLFADAEAPTLTGPAATLIGRLLYGFGYLASFVLFFRAHTREAVVGRLRWAYRRVGVQIQHAETVDGVERTTFRCPYRDVGADRVGQRRACHDVLDRVDDGYVTWLARHRELDYQRPRACAASACCYSEVSEL